MFIYNRHCRLSVRMSCWIKRLFTYLLTIQSSTAAADWWWCCQVFEANAGYKREFSLTNIDGEVFEEELSWGVESQIHVQPQHVAEATLMVDERRQTGSFVIETRMRGTVYVSFTSPRDNNAQVQAPTLSFHFNALTYLLTSNWRYLFTVNSNQLSSSFCQPHSVHCPPGSSHPVHITSQSPPSLSSPITASTFHSRLKTHLFHKTFPP